MGEVTSMATDACSLRFNDVSFSYPAELAPGEAHEVLSHVSLVVPEGAFALVVGATGSGKTTLLRLAKPELAPAGERSGAIEAFGRDVRGLTPVESASLVGFVSQNPDNQIVCDTVWHEMAFGLENLGCPEAEMRLRIAETANFLGLEHIFRSRCAELSGGQRALVALASVLVMRPRMLLLDEPTATLDPLAERDFLSMLFRANRELGTTVVVATHTPGPMVDYASCAFEVGGKGLREVEPGSLRGRVARLGTPTAAPGELNHDVVSLDDAWFRYGRDHAWVLRGFDLAVGEGEVRAVVGGNGSGKSTLLALVAGVERLQRGKVTNACRSCQALLPQNPKAILARETVADELAEWADDADITPALERIGLVGAQRRHPYDLSGGQQQLLALEKLLLAHPRLLLLDEPTKGLDEAYRSQVAQVVREAAEQGVTVILATHDLAFARAVAHSVTLLFDGQAVVTMPCEEFFASTWTYRSEGL